MNLLLFSTNWQSTVGKVDHNSLLGYMYRLNTFCAITCLGFSFTHYRITQFLQSVNDRVGER